MSACREGVRCPSCFRQSSCFGLYGHIMHVPLNPTILNDASVTAGSAALAAKICKHTNNDEKCTRLGWVCIHLAVESYGCWGDVATKCLDRLATRIATCTACPKSSAVSNLYGKLSITLIRANTRAILSRSLVY